MYQELYRRIESALKAGAEDDYGPHVPAFHHPRRTSGMVSDGTWRAEELTDRIEITTRYSRDPSRANNGGEYYHYTRFRPLPDGRIIQESRSSYEDDEWESHGVFGIVADLPAMAKLACARINAGNRPGPVNSKRLRRQIEDALRKTASDGDLVAIGGLLGIRAE